MIFNNSFAASSNNTSTFPYEANLEGALMCVYENECNYNALMKAVGISELKYYNETGKDLFLNEAGAFKDFANKVKDFFEKAIEKVKAIAGKFIQKLKEIAGDDAAFVKKYESELLKKDLTGFEAPEHYNYNGITKSLPAVGGVDHINKDSNMDDELAKTRAIILGLSEAVSAKDFTAKAKEVMYGEKTKEFDIKKCIDVVKSFKADTNDVETERDVVAAVNKKYIKELKLDKEYADGDELQDLNARIKFAKDVSNAYTAAFGVCLQAISSRRKEYKNILKKALAFKSKEKEEKATSESSIEDLFAGVVIM